MGEYLRSLRGRITKITMRVKALERQLVHLVKRVELLERFTGLREWEVDDWT